VVEELPVTTKIVAALRRALPRGHSLPQDAWRRRHRVLVGVLALQAGGILVYALARGTSLPKSLAYVAVPALLAAAAVRCPGRRLPAGLVAAGLLTSAAMVVHVSGGAPEAHFDFFIVVIFLTLYEDWLPFVMALVYVVIDHGLANSGGWGVAFLHAGFLLVAVVGLITVWRFNEDVRHRLRALLNGSGDAILEIDRRGDVVGWNPAAQATLGYAPEDIECRPATVLAAPGEEEELAAVVANALGGEPLQRHETTWARNDGKPVEVAITVSPISDAGRVIGASIIVHDMAERLALQEAEERFRDLVERVPAVTYVAEPGADGAWRYVSPQIEVMLGYTPEEWLRDPLLWARRIHPDDRERVVEEEERFQATREPMACEYRMVALDGTVVWVRDDAVFRTLLPGRADVMDGILTDVTELKMMEDRLRHMATHDHMTGLCNRHRFEEQLEQQVAYTRRYGTAGAVLVLDLDGVKRVNDELGHHAGDVLLKLVARRMSERLRAVDVVGRLGGDEFGVLLPGVDEAGARAVAEDLVGRVRDTRVEMEGRSVGTTASVGIAVVGADNGADAGRLMMLADSAMYEAKHAGGDRVAVYQPADGIERATAAG
jgi:diguanylate cyclase (GGDEF)-like protein/PAS domain S-box-containing protein